MERVHGTFAPNDGKHPHVRGVARVAEARAILLSARHPRSSGAPGPQPPVLIEG